MHHFSGHQSRRACALWGPEAGAVENGCSSVGWGLCQISHGPKKVVFWVFCLNEGHVSLLTRNVPKRIQVDFCWIMKKIIRLAKLLKNNSKWPFSLWADKNTPTVYAATAVAFASLSGLGILGGYLMATSESVGCFRLLLGGGFKFIFYFDPYSGTRGRFSCWLIFFRWVETTN